MPRQQNLFDSDPAPWEVDAQSERLVATVVLCEGPTNEFDYVVPEEMSDRQNPEQFVEPGRRLRVPFGRSNRGVEATCVRLGLKPVDPRRLKCVSRVIDPVSLVSPAMLRLTEWMADYYLCSWGQVLGAVVPASVRRLAGTREIKLLHLPHGIDRADVQAKLRSPQQRRAFEALADSNQPLTMTQLAAAADCTLAPIRTLLKQGVIEAKTKRVVSREVEQKTLPREKPLSLNADQQAALDSVLAALESAEPRGLLLHGVTGSGKTEVYLQAIERVVSFGRQAIVLVPEISLTPQTVQRFRSRFDSVAVLHSHQSDSDRHHQWQRIAQGEVQVVVGARSAVFAPTPHLGLVVIDEEHESSFKQDSAPRYHARDVAWQRALSERVPLVLGSATPSLESWQAAEEGTYERLSLPRRVLNRPLPDVATIDLRDPAKSRGGRGGISRTLHQAIVAALRDQGQVILLLNRRGYSTHLQCPACGYVLQCPHCDLPLTFHRPTNKALCHYCDHHALPPTTCPDCKSGAIRYGGLGTQKLEAEVRGRFPECVVARMDTDTMRLRGSHEEVLGRFRDGTIDILLGTQMIAKGLDFPNVTLVGVVNADTALHLPDFRAGERSFQLVAQVAGRTGRGEKGGRVLVQTLNPDHPAIMAAVRHDYAAFAAVELAQRKTLRYPPFGSIIRLVVRGPLEETTRGVAEELTARLKRSSAVDPSVRIMGPAPAAIPKLRGQHRFQTQLQSPEMPRLREIVREATEGFKLPRDVVLTIDVDPWDMM
jgi:primosomal protein N' (replication factor Y)